jgi:LacI family transcriptional regulator
MTKNDLTERGVRLKDVAEALGLSISTVSAVLHKKPNFNATTRKRVLKKIQELNYRPNWLARGLASQKTHVLGVIVPNLSRPFFPHVLDGIDKITDAAGYNLVVFNSDDDPAREERGLETLLGRKVDGLIVASARDPQKNLTWTPGGSSKVPFVLIDRFFPSVPFVGADDELVGYIVTRHLIEQGYKSIAHLSARKVVTGYGRYRGFVRALRENGLRARRDHVVEVQWGEFDGGYAGTQELLSLRNRPDAIFAVNDLVGIGAMMALEHAGVEIPGECGLIGVGSVRFGDCLRTPLSTVNLHPTEVGKTSARILLNLIAGKRSPKEAVFLKPELIIRESSRRDPAPPGRTAFRFPVISPSSQISRGAQQTP